MSKLLWNHTFSSEIQQGVGVADLVVGVVALKGAVVDLKEGVTVKVGVTVKAAATKVGVTVKVAAMKVDVTVKEAAMKVGVTVKVVDMTESVAEAVDEEAGGDSTGVTGLPTWKMRGTSPL